jgi:hypothetical protein
LNTVSPAKQPPQVYAPEFMSAPKYPYNGYNPAYTPNLMNFLKDDSNQKSFNSFYDPQLNTSEPALLKTLVTEL